MGFRIQGLAWGMGVGPWGLRLRAVRSRANMPYSLWPRPHKRRSRPNSGLGFQKRVLQTFPAVPSSLLGFRADSVIAGE
jgi:hypothetical protein